MGGLVQGTDRSLERVGRLRRREIQGAGDAVVAEQDGLRSAQGLGLGHVHEGRAGELGSTVVDIIYVESDRLLETLIDAGADAADVKVGADARFRHRKVGNVGNQFLDPADPRFRHGLARKHDHRQGRVLQAFRDFAGGDRDFFQGFLGAGYGRSGDPGNEQDAD